MPPEETSTEKMKDFCVLIVSAVVTVALNGWLLSICASFLVPSFFLSFWQWCLIAFTVRLLVVYRPID